MNRMTRVYHSLILEEAIETLEYTTEDVYWDVDCALTEPGDVTIVTASTASTDVTYLDIDNDVEEEEDLFGDPYKDLELDDDEPAVTPHRAAPCALRDPDARGRGAMEHGCRRHRLFLGCFPGRRAPCNATPPYPKRSFSLSFAILHLPLIS